MLTAPINIVEKSEQNVHEFYKVLSWIFKNTLFWIFKIKNVTKIVLQQISSLYKATENMYFLIFPSLLDIVNLDFTYYSKLFSRLFVLKNWIIVHIFKRW